MIFGSCHFLFHQFTQWNEPNVNLILSCSHSFRCGDNTIAIESAVWTSH